MPTLTKLFAHMEEPERKAQALEAQRIAGQGELNELTAKLQRAEKAGEIPPGYSPFLYRHVNAQLGRRAVQTYKEKMDAALDEFHNAENEESPYDLSARITQEVAAEFNNNENVDFGVEWEQREEYDNQWHRKAFDRRGQARLKQALDTESDLIRDAIDRFEYWTPTDAKSLEALISFHGGLSARTAEFAKNVRDATGRAVPPGAVKNMLWLTVSDKVNSLMASGDLDDMKEAKEILEMSRSFDLTKGKLDPHAGDGGDKSKRSKTSFDFMFAKEIGEISQKLERATKIAEDRQGAQGFTDLNVRNAFFKAVALQFVKDGEDGTLRAMWAKERAEGTLTTDSILEELDAVIKANPLLQKAALSEAAKRNIAGAIFNDMDSYYQQGMNLTQNESISEKNETQAQKMQMEAQNRSTSSANKMALFSKWEKLHAQDGGEPNPVLYEFAESLRGRYMNRHMPHINEVNNSSSGSAYKHEAERGEYVARAYNVIRNNYPELDKWLKVKGVESFAELKATDPTAWGVMQDHFQKDLLTDLESAITVAIDAYETTPKLQEEHNGGALDPRNNGLGLYLNSWITGHTKDVVAALTEKGGQGILDAVRDLNRLQAEDLSTNKDYRRRLKELERQEAAAGLDPEDPTGLEALRAELDPNGRLTDITTVMGPSFDQWNTDENMFSYGVLNMSEFGQDPVKFQKNILKEGGQIELWATDTTPKWSAFVLASVAAAKDGSPYSAIKIANGEIVLMTDREYTEGKASGKLEGPQSRRYESKFGTEWPQLGDALEVKAKNLAYWSVRQRTGAVYTRGGAPMNSAWASNPENITMFAHRMTDYKEKAGEPGSYRDENGMKPYPSMLDPTKSLGLFAEGHFLKYPDGSKRQAELEEQDDLLLQYEKLYKAVDTLSPSRRFAELDRIDKAFAAEQKANPPGTLLGDFIEDYSALPADVRQRVPPHVAFAAQLQFHQAPRKARIDLLEGAGYADKRAEDLIRQEREGIGDSWNDWKTPEQRAVPGGLEPAREEQKKRQRAERGNK